MLFKKTQNILLSGQHASLLNAWNFGIQTNCGDALCDVRQAESSCCNLLASWANKSPMPTTNTMDSNDYAALLSAANWKSPFQNSQMEAWVRALFACHLSPQFFKPPVPPQCERHITTASTKARDDITAQNSRVANSNIDMWLKYNTLPSLTAKAIMSSINFYN